MVRNKNIERICRRNGIHALWLFGSRAVELRRRLAGEQSPEDGVGSDIDIAALPEKGRQLSARDRVRLAIELEDLLKTGSVDLVVVSEAPTYLAVEAVCGELVVDRDPDETARFELYVLSRAGDLARFTEMRREAVLKGGAL